MAAGSIVIDLLLKTGTFETDTARAQKALKQLKAEADDLAKKAGIAFVAAATGLGYLVKSSIDAEDHLADLSKKTGIAADTLGGIGFAAQQSGGDLDSAAAATGKLNKSLAEAAAGNAKAAEAFDVLGVSVKDAAGNTKNADVILGELADKFAGLEDGPEKVALAIRIFGKAGADMIPLLDEGGKSLRDNIDYFKKYSGVTQETAEQSLKFHETLQKLNLLSGAFGKTLAADLLPSLQNLADLLVENKEKGDEMVKTASELAELVKVLSFSTIAAGLGFLAFGKAIGGASAAADAFKQGRFSDALEISRETLTDLGAAKDRIEGIYDAIFTGRKKTGPFDVIDFGHEPRKKAPRLGADNGIAKDDFTPLIKKIGEMQAETELALESEDTLTEAQKLGAKIAKDYRDGVIQLTDAQLQYIDSTLKTVSAEQKALEAKKENERWIQQATDDNANFIESQMHLRDSLLEVSKAADIELEAFGHSRDEVDKLATARMRETAAALEQKAAIADADGFLGDVAKLYREQARLIRQTADARDFLTEKERNLHYDSLTGATQAVKDYLDSIDRAGDETYKLVQSTFQSLEDAAVNALTTGNIRDAAKQMVNQILAEVYRLAVVRPLLKSIFDGNSGGLGGFLSGLFNGSGLTVDTAGQGINNTGTSLPTAGGAATGTNFVERDMLTILHKGEAVVPKAYNPSSLGSGRGTVINISNNGQPVTAREESRQQTDQGTIINLVLDAVARDVQQGGKTHRAIAGTYGVSRAAGAPKRG